MAVLTREEYFTRLQDYLGDDTSDKAITFLEDMTDTYNYWENISKGDGIDWEEKYRELDETWKKRYQHRFFSGSPGNYFQEELTEEEKAPEEITVEELFVEKKEEDDN